MVVGNQEIFAIEIGLNDKITEPGYEDWIGYGYFVVYIAGHPYGVKKENATLLYGIYYALLDMRERKNFSTLPTENFLDSEIANAYFYLHYDATSQLIKNVNPKVKEVLQNAKIEWPPLECANDDSSILLQIQEEKLIRLIGFYISDKANEDIHDIHSIKVSKDYFDTVIISALEILDNFKLQR